MLIQQYLLFCLQIPFTTALIDNVVFNGALTLIGFFIHNVLSFYNPHKERYFYILGLIFITTFWVLFCKWILMHIFANDVDYLLFLNKSIPFRLGVGGIILIPIAFTSELWHQIEEQNQTISRNLYAENLAKEAELFKLRQQLQPHFLFNSLNSISALVGTRPEEARSMIFQLSDFLRGTLKREDIQFVSLAEEIEYLGLYLSIEKVRFGHRLETEIKLHNNSEKCNIPPMLLQPIVENAIKFGLYDTTENVKICIESQIVKNELTITVSNPYDPQTATPRTGTGFGLSAIKRRLFLIFARQDLLHTNTENNLFTTTLIIPQKND